MKRILPFLIILAGYFSASAQIISQYIETSSGSTPKGIEIWNNTLSELNFATNSLVIEKGTNGAIPSLDFSLSSGTLAPGNVIVIGTSDLQTVVETVGAQFFLKAFTFNGDDALVVKYGGVITDVFGVPGSDPGTAWSGSGVSTANQNIVLKQGIETGAVMGWSDPSLRFEVATTDNSPAGMGVAPVRIIGTLNVSPKSLGELSYVFGQGPSISMPITLSGTGLTSPVVVTPPVAVEISNDNISFYSQTLSFTPVVGTLDEKTIYVRLVQGLEIGSYPNLSMEISSVGAVSSTVDFSGRVKYSELRNLPNAWINEFHYDNDGDDLNEFVEIAIENAGIFDLSDFTVSLYNGGTGTVYDARNLGAIQPVSTRNGVSFFCWNPASIQNGAPDGFALDYKGESVCFISYEGAFVATDGPALGLTSVDTGISESSTKTLVGSSIQLVGTGNTFEHFRWISQVESPGHLNTYQSIDEFAPPVPVDSRGILAFFVLLSAGVVWRKVRR